MQEPKAISFRGVLHHHFTELSGFGLQVSVNILGALEQQEQQKFLVAISGDHTTPTFIGDHSFEPVPFLVAPINFDFPQQGC